VCSADTTTGETVAGDTVEPVHDPAGAWASDVVLADGGTVHLRRIRADDDEKLLGLYERLSDESRYLRFFSPVSAPTAAQLEQLTRVDGDPRFALVAELGDEIVAVARFDRLPGTTDAEVAFAVQDDQQGRGLGTILLEHLAAAARSGGVQRFVASTLPNNRRMLDVFLSAGFEADRSFADGTVQVSFPIEPTASSVAAQRAREHVSEAASVARIFTPRSIAVIGAGRRRATIGHEVFRNLLRGDFTGPVYPVNPNADVVASVRTYATVLDVPDAVDLAVVTVPAPAVLGAVQQCARKGVRSLVVISAGFAEVGGLQADAERELVDVARLHGMRLVGPNCMGVVNTNPAVSMHATFAPFAPPAGRVAFSSQSGALGIELMAQAAQLGLGISSFVSVGNKADVSGNDLLQYWEDDAETDVILLYLESFGNPRKFSRLARRIARRKPIVAVKSGRSGSGRRAASSHTAALASPDVAVDALFGQAGVIRVDTLEQLFDTAQVLANQPLPPGRRVAIVSNGGGPGTLAADACEAADLEVPELPPATQGALREFVSADAAVTNPLDLVASATAEQYHRTLRAVLEEPTIDAVIVIFVPPLVTAAEDVARAVVDAAEGAEKPVVTCFLGHHGVPEMLRRRDGGSDGAAIPSFRFPESAAAALARVAAHAEWRRRPEGVEPALTGIEVERARALVVDFLADAPDGGWLDAPAAADLFSCFGIPVAATRSAEHADGAVAAAEELGYPVALKAGAGGIVHKTDVGGVRLDLASAAEVRGAFDDMRARLGDAMGPAVLQRMLPPGVETIVGVVQDPSFGPLVLFGMGGTAAELLRDSALRILPITDRDAHDLVRSLRTSPLLFGYRGTPAGDVAALEEVLLRVGRLADAIPELAETDANPVVVWHEGVCALDVKVRLEPAPARLPRGLRRLR
jgi:acetyl coenzyme A synthetase (ADP forming)-like protein